MIRIGLPGMRAIFLAGHSQNKLLRMCALQVFWQDPERCTSDDRRNVRANSEVVDTP